jgi:hypothetical protein
MFQIPHRFYITGDLDLFQRKVALILPMDVILWKAISHKKIGLS